MALTAQSITFATLTGKTFGNAPFSVSATASSGLAVSFSSLTTSVCTVSGATVTIVAVGSCTIRASQAGNATYAPAPNVDRSFTIAKANQTITFASLAGKTFGSSPFVVAATTSSGLAVAFSSATTGVCTVSVATVTIVATGTCTIRASQAGNANYNAAPDVNRTFTVAKAAQTITFAALGGKTYGNAPFTVSATASSGLTVTYSSTTTAVCTVSTATVTIVAAGSCTIKSEQAGNANYSAAPSISRSFTVVKASQTISFAPLADRQFGTAPFTVSATASSGLAPTFASTTTAVCTVGGNTVTIIGMDACTIRASQSGNANYLAATGVLQTFYVQQGSQSITFGALADRDLGNPDFAISATASSGLAVAFAPMTTAVCSFVDALTVTMYAVGLCTIEASQDGDATYLPAPNVNRSFAVIGMQTITFGPVPDLPINSSPRALTASASSGLPVSFASATAATCSVSGGNVSPVAQGACTIRATQPGNAFYRAAPLVDQSFAVSAPQRTIQYTYDGAGNVVRMQTVLP